MKIKEENWKQQRQRVCEGRESGKWMKTSTDVYWRGRQLLRQPLMGTEEKWNDDGGKKRTKKNRNDLLFV